MGEEHRGLIEQIKRSMTELLETERRRRSHTRGTPDYDAAHEEEGRAAQRVFEAVRQSESSRQASDASDARPRA